MTRCFLCAKTSGGVIPVDPGHLRKKTAQYQSETISPNECKGCFKGASNSWFWEREGFWSWCPLGQGKTFLSTISNSLSQKECFYCSSSRFFRKSLTVFKKVLQFSDAEALIYHSGADLTGKKICVYYYPNPFTWTAFGPIFQRDYFDYILIDEVHKAGANSYKKVMAYFQPEFFLGMTATQNGQMVRSIYDCWLQYCLWDSSTNAHDNDHAFAHSFILG